MVESAEWDENNQIRAEALRCSLMAVRCGFPLLLSDCIGVTEVSLFEPVAVAR